MAIKLVQAIGRGARSSTIAATVEAEVARGTLPPGSKLPTVRSLAAELKVSPATVAAAYRTLKQRGLVVADRGHGTQVAPEPPVRVKRTAELPSGAVDLASGNPDPKLLPSLGTALAQLDITPKLYGGAATLPELAAHAQTEFAGDGIDGEVGVTAGAVDAIERALQTELRPGDQVAVEDPTWPRIPDLVRALGLAAEPVAVDRHGLDPDRLDAVLRRGARAVIATPRGHNPTGAWIDPARGHELRAVLTDYPHVLVIEDDYVARISGLPYVPVHRPESRYVVVRSMSKVLGPDLRIGLIAGDPLTTSRIQGRQHLSPGWISHILQQLAADILSDPATGELLARAEQTYADRRRALVEALAARSIPATGDSGLGVWVPLADEAAAASQLLVQGWAVSPGERFRVLSAPGIRITTATLLPDQAEQLADAIAALGRAPATTYAG